MTILPMMPVSVPTAAIADGAAVPTDTEGGFAALFAAVLTRSETSNPAPQPPQSPETDENGETPAAAVAVAATPVTEETSDTTVAPDVPAEGPVAAEAVLPPSSSPSPPAVPVAVPTQVPAAPSRTPTETGLDELDDPMVPPAHALGERDHPTPAPTPAPAPAPAPAVEGLEPFDRPTATPATTGRDTLDHSGLPTAAPGSHTPAAPTAPTAPIAPTAPTAPTAPAAPTTAAGPISHPVLDQVKPSFTKLVSGPEGMHRMTLRLHPADLGEIHLTVRVQGDTVEVTVAASPEARAVLTENQGELRGLLDAVGRTASQITFRDLPGSGQAAAPPFAANPDGQPPASHQQPSLDRGATGDGDRNGHNSGRTADEPSSSPQDGRSGVPAEPRPTTTSTIRPAGLVRGGLDVRM